MEATERSRERHRPHARVPCLSTEAPEPQATTPRRQWGESGRREYGRKGCERLLPIHAHATIRASAQVSDRMSDLPGRSRSLGWLLVSPLFLHLSMWLIRDAGTRHRPLCRESEL